MNSATLKALKGVRWLVLLSLACCTLYVLVMFILDFVWYPYQSAQLGRPYMAHNWEHLLRNFLPWHVIVLTICITLISVVWKYVIPEPDDRPPEWLMTSDNLSDDALPQWRSDTAQVKRRIPPFKDG